MFSFANFLKGLSILNDADQTKVLSLTVSPSATTGTTLTIVAAQTSNQTLTLPDSTATLSTSNSTETLTNKTISGASNTLLAIPGAQINAGSIPIAALGTVTDGITLDQAGAGSTLEVKVGGISNTQVNAAAAIALTKLAATTANRVLQSDGSGVITPSAVTTTTLGFLDATSSVQTQINSKPTISGSLINGDIVVGAGASSVKTTGIAVDGSNNMTAVHSITLDSGGLSIGVVSSNAIQANSSSALLLTTNSTSQQVYTDRQFFAIGSGPGVLGSIAIRGDTSLGGTNFINILPPANITANRTQSLPNASGTFLLDTSTQTLTNKTVGDSLTMTQIATPSTPAAGTDKLYVKSDDRAYVLNSAGTETALAFSNLVVQSKSANYTAVATDDLILGTTGSAFQVTLPTAVGISGKQYRIKKVSSDTNTLTVGTTSAQTIDGITTFPLYNQWDELTVVSNGANWDILNYVFAKNIVYSNSGFSQTAPALNNTWFNVVGNNVSLNSGTWELTCSLWYTNNGSNPGYTDKYAYWCAATGTNTTTAPAALNTLAGLTVLGGYTAPYIDNSSTDATSMVLMQPLIIQLTQPQTIFVGTRANTSTFANLRMMPTITAKRIY